MFLPTTGWGLTFPWKDYLYQPLFQRDRIIILNPVRYWRCYRQLYLEQCYRLPALSPHQPPTGEDN